MEDKNINLLKKICKEIPLMPDIKFTNPTLTVPADERRTVYVRIPVSDFNLLRIVRSDTGTITTTVNILIKKLCDECRKRGINDLTRSNDFERLVQSIGFVDDTSAIVSREEYDELKLQSTDYQRIIAANAGGLRDSTTSGSARKTHGRNVPRRTPGKGGGDTTAKEGTNGV